MSKKEIATMLETLACRIGSQTYPAVYQALIDQARYMNPEPREWIMPEYVMERDHIHTRPDDMLIKRDYVKVREVL